MSILCFRMVSKGACAFLTSRLCSSLLTPSSVAEFIYGGIGEGKLAFDFAGSEIQQLGSLKSVERIFLLVKYEKNITLGYKSDFYNLISLLEGIDTWQEIHDRWSTLKSSSTCDGEPTTAKRAKKGVSFRVSCRCRQKAARLFDVKRLSRTVATIISRKTGWQSCLKQPDIEVSIHINGEGTVIGIPLFEKPLAERSYLRYHGLRPTTSWILANLANIQKGDVVLDPMCGKGVILIEAAKEWQLAQYIGSDIDESALSQCQENLNFAGLTTRISLFHADVANLPLENANIDRIICDLPFGINHGSVDEVLASYPRYIHAMDRVLKPGGRAVLLTSATLKEHLLTCCVASKVRMNTDRDKKQDNGTLDSDRKDGTLLAYAVKESVESTKSESVDIPGTSCSSNLRISDQSGAIPSHSDMQSSVNKCHHTESDSLANRKESKDNSVTVSTDIAKTSNSLKRCEDDPALNNKIRNHMECVNESSIHISSKVKEDARTKSDGLSSNEEMSLSTDDAAFSINDVGWTLISEHYLKLGETEACACVFQKAPISDF